MKILSKNVDTFRNFELSEGDEQNVEEVDVEQSA